jgi:hypothetical protein
VCHPCQPQIIYNSFYNPSIIRSENGTLLPKVIGSRFRVQARPGATGCVFKIAFIFYGIGFPSPDLEMPGLGQGFKGYKMLISITLHSTVWIGHFHPLGETAL